MILAKCFVEKKKVPTILSFKDAYIEINFFSLADC